MRRIIEGFLVVAVIAMLIHLGLAQFNKSEAEDNFKAFTSAQKEMLQGKFIARQTTEQGLNEWVAYLQKEHGVDGTWKIRSDFSGFERAPETKPVEPNE